MSDQTDPGAAPMARVIEVDAGEERAPRRPLAPRIIPTERTERMRRKRIDALSDLEWRKPQVRHLAERAAAQKPAGLKKAQAVAVARFDEIGAIAIMPVLRDLLARGLVGPVLSDKPEKVARDLGAHALAQRPQRRT